MDFRLPPVDFINVIQSVLLKIEKVYIGTVMIIKILKPDNNIKTIISGLK
jgi:hypothetical protein